MEQSHQLFKNRFDQGMASDFDPHHLPPRSYQDALNILSSPSGNEGVATNTPGSIPVFASGILPAGDNQVIGQVEDQRTESIFFFVWNSNKQHSIVRYTSDYNFLQSFDVNTEPDGSTSFLAHTEPLSSGLYRIDPGQFTFYTEDSIINPRNFTFEVRINGAVVGSDVKTISGGGTLHTIRFGPVLFSVSDPTATVEFWVVSNTFENMVTAQDTWLDTWVLERKTLGGKIIFQEPALNFRKTWPVHSAVVADGRFLIWTDATLDDEGNPVGNPVKMIDLDFTYPANLDERMITLIKPAPQPAPLQADYMLKGAPENPFSGENTLYQKPHQFRYRYRYWDGTLSAWSPVSNIPTNWTEQKLLPGITDANEDLLGYTNVIGASEEYNTIRLTFNDPFLSNTSDWRELITSVQIARRDSLSSPWYFVADIDLDEINTLGQYKIGNNLLQGVVPSDEVGSADVQSLKNFDHVPRLALALEQVADKQGNALLLLGGCFEQYELLTSFGAEITGTVSLSVTPHPYPPVNPPTLTPRTPNPPDVQGTAYRTLKHGGEYTVGVKFFDNYGRESSVVVLDTVRVPYKVANGELVGLDVTINGMPSWASSWKIVISNNKQATLSFYDFTYGAFRYRVMGDGIENVDFDFNSDEANAIGLTLSGIANFQESETALGGKAVNNVRYTPARFDVRPGDRIQFIDTALRTLNPGSITPIFDDTNIDDFNFEILQAYPNLPDSGADPLYTDRLTVLLKAEDIAEAQGGSIVDFLQGYMVEIYRPREVDDNVFFELPQSYSAGTLSVSVTDIGDVYQIWQGVPEKLPVPGDLFQVVLYAGFIEVPNLTISQIESGEPSFPEHGRLGIEDPLYGEKYFATRIRAGDLYQEQSLINGLGSFRGSNFISVNQDFGPIRKLASVDQLLLAVCEYKAQPVYVQKDRLMQLDVNQNLVGRTNQLLNIASELQYDLGTVAPLSIVVDQGRIYGWDSYRGVVWRYATGNGMQPISYQGNRRLFVELGKKYHNGDASRGGIDRKRNIYFLTLDSTLEEPVTYGFKDLFYREQESYFHGRFSFTPDHYSQLGTDMYLFQGDQMERFDAGGFYNYYFGVTSPSQITWVVNGEPDLIKLFHNLNLVSNGVWELSLVTAPAGVGDQDKVSGLSNEHGGVYEGQWFADFLRDQQDPAKRFSDITDPTEREQTALLQGRLLRGEVLIIEARLLNPNAAVTLTSATTAWSMSESTR